MPRIETYFLIDFENVKEDGIVCSDKLTECDHIHIFSTENTPKITFNTLARLNDADLNIHVVPCGKQSLDMHLVSYLGYLTGLNNISQKNYKYIIVSKDSDYDNIISFFKQLTNIDIIRQSTLDHIETNESNI